MKSVNKRIALESNTAGSHEVYSEPDEVLTSQINDLKSNRAGHIPLNSSLYRFGLTGTPFCKRGAEETVIHFLLECQLNVNQRSCVILSNALVTFRNLFFLNRTEYIYKVFTFISDSERLPNFKISS